MLQEKDFGTVLKQTQQKPDCTFELPSEMCPSKYLKEETYTNSPRSQEEPFLGLFPCRSCNCNDPVHVWLLACFQHCPVAFSDLLVATMQEHLDRFASSSPPLTSRSPAFVRFVRNVMRFPCARSILVISILRAGKLLRCLFRTRARLLKLRVAHGDGIGIVAVWPFGPVPPYAPEAACEEHTECH
eukprot:g19351.t1